MTIHTKDINGSIHYYYIVNGLHMPIPTQYIHEKEGK